ncbi:MAG: adenosine kinase [Clostridia bacterium]|jgi:sugar/nucleoside kinase (ribokinase family)
MKLACVGNALVDVIAFVETDFLSEFGMQAGSTSHVDHKRLKPILAALQNPAISAGGGAANTARTFVNLGYEAAFAGCVGQDVYAERYAKDLRGVGVDVSLQHRVEPTGVFCALIAPDGRRSVVVSPSAALSFRPEAVSEAFFNKDAVLYMDGFLAAVPGAMEILASRARAAGMKIALDVAGHGIATAFRERFTVMIQEYCDWVFMNEDEFLAVTGESMDSGLINFSASVSGTVVVKLAEAGAVCARRGSVTESPVRSIRVTDETGAGDAFAAGFLSAALSGVSLARCLRLGNRVAEQVIQIPGVSLGPERLQRASAAVL